MKTNKAGLDLLHRSEGLASTIPNTDARVKGKMPRIANKSELENQDLILYPYYDIVGVKTIGYGHTMTFKSNPDAFKRGVSKKFCDELFSDELVGYENGVSKNIHVGINENQFSALVSFCYNLGVGALQISTLRKKINEDPNDFETIGKEFRKWNKAGGRVIGALVRRREDEFKLYSTPIVPQEIKPSPEILIPSDKEEEVRFFIRAFRALFNSK